MPDYLNPTYYIDSDNEQVINFAKETIKDLKDPLEISIALYYKIRDQFQYNPYDLKLEPFAYKASYLLTKDYGHCIEKSILLAACCRVAGIPSRLGFANVTNHIGTERLEKILKTNVLYFHGFTEIYLNEKWVKATPAFNKELCEKLHVKPLDFNGLEDSIFQEYNNNGKAFMEYLEEIGIFDDFPFDLFLTTIKDKYAHLLGYL